MNRKEVYKCVIIKKRKQTVAIKKIPKNTIVFHLKEKLFLIRPHGGDSLSYVLSEIKNAKQSHVLSGPFAHTKKGQKNLSVVSLTFV